MVEQQNGRLLVLGAGRGQVGLIKAAKRLGVEVLVATMPGPKLPGAPFADRIVDVDISDPAAVEAAARDWEVTSIATSCLDAGVPALGHVADALGLRGLSEHAAILCRDKLLMKAAMVSAGVRTAPYADVATPDELEAAVAEIGLPLIMKAPNLQGSQGVMVVRTAAEAREAFEFAQGASGGEHIVVEEFIEGEEFGAQAMVHDGEIVFIVPHGDEVHVFGEKTPVPVGHSVPMTLSEAAAADAIEQCGRAIRALGLDNCAVNIDLMRRGEEVYVIELSGRAGANGLPEMLTDYFGLDYYETIARLALGQAPGPEYTSAADRPAVAVRMLTAPDAVGTVTSIELDPWVRESLQPQLFKAVGDELDGFSSSNDCIGQVVAVAGTLPEAFDTLDRAEKTLRIETEQAAGQRA